MAQHEISKMQGKVLDYLQKVSTTYESNKAIGKRLGMSQPIIRNCLINLERICLIEFKQDEGQRLISVTKLGKKHLVILEELEKGFSWK